MHWDNEAEEGMKKVPIFVRRIVRERVEKHAIEKGRATVSIIELQEARSEFVGGLGGRHLAGQGSPSSEVIEKMISDVEQKGVITTSFFVIKVCGAQFGCPMQVMNPKPLADRLMEILAQSGLEAFLQDRTHGRILPHHKFKVALSGCPNARSQPQICDFGAVAHGLPNCDSELCTGCRQCGEVCHESAIDFPEFAADVNYLNCIGCGDCIRECPSEALAVERAGYTVMAGGKLGRHPQLAVESFHLASDDDVAAALHVCIQLYMERAIGDQKFADVFKALGTEFVRRAIDESRI